LSLLIGIQNTAISYSNVSMEQATPGSIHCADRKIQTTGIERS